MNSPLISSASHYEQSMQSPSAYRVHAQSQPSTFTYQDYPAKKMTNASENTHVSHIPSSQQMRTSTVNNNSMGYNIQDRQPKFEPVAFQVSTAKDNGKSTSNTNDSQDPNPFKIFGAKLRSRPLQGIVPSYADETTDRYAQ
jgi:hypothetical protein